MITKKTALYEVLFRITAGAISGAHRRDLEIVSDDETGEVYSVKELDPQPIEGEGIDAVLGNICAAQQSTLNALDIQLAEKEGQLQRANEKEFDLEDRLQKALGALEARDNELSGAAQQLEQMEEYSIQLESRVQDLDRRFAEVQPLLDALQAVESEAAEEDLPVDAGDEIPFVRAPAELVSKRDD